MEEMERLQRELEAQEAAANGGAEGGAETPENSGAD